MSTAITKQRSVKMRCKQRKANYRVNKKFNHSSTLMFQRVDYVGWCSYLCNVYLLIGIELKRMFSHHCLEFRDCLYSSVLHLSKMFE